MDHDARQDADVEWREGMADEDIVPTAVPVITGLYPGQRAGLVVSAEQRRAHLTATVAAVGRDTVQLALSPFDRAMSPAVGAVAQLQTASRRGELVQVLAVQPAFEPLLMLRSIARPVSDELRQTRRQILVRPPTVLASILAAGRVRAVRIAVIDLSARGAGVLASVPVAVGDRLRLRLDRTVQPGQDLAAWDATVIWSETIGDFWRAGIQFGELSAAHRFWLAHTIDEAEADWQALLDLAKSSA